jgi:hypothetical protein
MLAELPLNAQLISVGEEPALYMPPPKSPVLLSNVQLVSVGEEVSLHMPPPRPEFW